LIFNWGGAKLKVYINSKNRNNPRQLVDVELIKENNTTVVVKLPDGNVIIRKKKRDLPQEE
jgi:hypothetical protein